MKMTIFCRRPDGRGRTAAFGIFFFAVCAFFAIYAQENGNIGPLRQDFAKADLAGKVTILKRLSASKNAAAVPLYKDAVEYTERAYRILQNDPQLLDLGTMAVTGLGEFKEKSAAQNIRYLFSTIENEAFKIACLKSLSVLIERDSVFTAYLNTLYENGFSDLLAGKKFNINLLAAIADALKSFADPSSFEILFKTLLYPVSEKLKTAVKSALNDIPFDYYSEIVGKQDREDLQYIYTLYVSAKENRRLEKQDLGKISEAAIRYGLENADSYPEQSERLIAETLNVLSDLHWSNASDSVNAYFFRTQKKRKTGEDGVSALIPVIECMGNLGTAESSANLSIFLGVLNSETEKTKEYSERLMLALIKALEKLGDKTAFDYLLNIEYLNYSETVKQAAKDAIGELKW